MRSTRFLLPLARYRETDRRMDGQDGHWLRHPSHGGAGSSCFHTLKGVAGRGGCVCRRRVCSPVAHLGPETGRSRKDWEIVLLAALAMNGGMDGGSVALRTTPRAWLVRKASGVVIGFWGSAPHWRANAQPPRAADAVSHSASTLQFRREESLLPSFCCRSIRLHQLSQRSRQVRVGIS